MHISISSSESYFRFFLITINCFFQKLKWLKVEFKSWIKMFSRTSMKFYNSFNVNLKFRKEHNVNSYCFKYTTLVNVI